ncbi:TonB-dependent receptor domain-containing protein [Oxalobacter paraformigenes]|uniref:TonB-dependent vitamin B12 receptor n=1 Tax=Oxalobacter paraformigenes TaxID=556268 RepID=C3X4G2_9BURK|nr:TonB-dependent receptor [Oxalobacter paraformigenes]EEO28098.1 TonB-dependent vitamin B12 receptor [Oxalobacter paraformigenes]
MHSPLFNCRSRSAIKPLLLVSLLSGCFAGSAFAQENGRADMDEKTLEPVVVTASRVEQLQKDAIPSTTIITSETIQNKKLADLPSLLRSEAGIELVRSGGAGTAASLFMRGNESRHLLVLLDGVPIQDSLGAGSTELLSHIQPDQIDHIEVVRGNVSSIYGSGAIGGVIQIFTKQGTGKPAAHVFAEYGSHDTVKLGAGVSGKTEAGTGFALSVTRYKTNGFSAMNSSKDSTVNPDDDRDRNVSVNAALSQRLDRDHEIGARLYMYDARFDFDGQSGIHEEADGKSKQWTTALYSKNRFTRDWLSTLTFSYNSIERHANVLDGDWVDYGYGPSNNDYRSRYRSETKLLQWENRLALSSDWTLTAGMDLGTENGYVSNRNLNLSYGSYSMNVDRDKYSAYAGLLGNVGAHSLQANVRYDHVEDAGSDTTGFLGYGYELTPSWKLLASVSTSFLAPTLDQLYNPEWGGNEDLESERSTNYEAGIQYARGKDLIRLSVFEWHTRHLISYSAGKYMNVNRAKSTGVELNMSTDILGVDVGANLTWQNPRNRETDAKLDRRAEIFGSLNVSKTLGKWYLGGDLLFTGHRPDKYYDANTYSNVDVTLPSFTLVNLNARYDIDKNVSLYARIENLFDKDYETVYGYNQPDRGAYVGVNVKM